MVLQRGAHLLPILILILAIGLPTAATAEPSAMTLQLDEAIRLGRQNSPELALKQLDLEIAEELRSETLGRIAGPRLSAESYSGLVSEARGDATGSPDEAEEYDDLGPFFKIDLKVIQPLYTFGKFLSAKEANRYNIEMQGFELQSARNDVDFQIITAYLTCVAGEDGQAIGDRLRESYQRLLDEIGRRLADQEAGITGSTLLQARAMAFEIEKQAGQGVEMQTKAALLLRGLLGLPAETRLLLEHSTPPAWSADTDLPARAVAFARKNSPQLQAIAAGIAALEHKEVLEKKKILPDLFVVGGAGYGTAPNRDKQVNPFIEDSYNYEKIGAAFGLKWDFNYQAASGAEKQAMLERRKVLEQQRAAALQLAGEVRLACAEAARQAKLLDTATESLRAATSWLRLESENDELGIGEVKELVAAYRQYFTLQAEEAEARYKYQKILSQLAKGLGNSQLFLTWEQNGLVEIDD